MTTQTVMEKLIEDSDGESVNVARVARRQTVIYAGIGKQETITSLLILALLNLSQPLKGNGRILKILGSRVVILTLQ